MHGAPLDVNQVYSVLRTRNRVIPSELLIRVTLEQGEVQPKQIATIIVLRVRVYYLMYAFRLPFEQVVGRIVPQRAQQGVPLQLNYLRYALLVEVSLFIHFQFEFWHPVLGQFGV